MLDYVYLSPTPLETDCAQVGSDDYRERAKIEMNAFIGQLYRMFPDSEDKNVMFKIKWQSHDFGTYGEVVAAYRDDDREALDYAIYIENNLPEYWDTHAMKEIDEGMAKLYGEYI
ncbi:MAG: hypothetical protein RL463_721 [Bacteroidota bacterium]